MIGLVSTIVGKGGRIMVPTTSRSYKGGRFLGQHGGLLKTSKGGRVLGSKLPRIVRNRTKPLDTKIKVPHQSTARKRPIRRRRVRVQRQRKRSQSLKSVPTISSTLKQTARSALKGVVRQGKRSLKSSAKQFMHKVPKTLVREVPKLLAREAPKLVHKAVSRKRHYEGDDEEDPTPTKRRRFHMPPSVKKGYLSGTKQYGGSRLF